MKSFWILFKCLLCHDTAVIQVWILIFLYQKQLAVWKMCASPSEHWVVTGSSYPDKDCISPFPPDAFLLMLTRAMGAEVMSFSGQDSRSRFTFTFYQLNSFEHKALGEDWNTREKETGSLNYSMEGSYPPTQECLSWVVKWMRNKPLLCLCHIFESQLFTAPNITLINTEIGTSKEILRNKNEIKLIWLNIWATDGKGTDVGC